jgi:transposase
LAWIRRSLVPRLPPRDIVLLDNLKARTPPAVRAAIERGGARVRYLPPYSHDFNPIESAWALVKKHIRTCAPRHAAALRRVARAARHVVRPHHCVRWLLMPGTAIQVLSGIRQSLRGCRARWPATSAS